MLDQVRILLIDDDKQLCELLSSYLALEGLNVETAHTAKAAMRKIRQTEYDILLIDLKLPDADGMDLVFDFQEGLEAGIIVLTGSTRKVNKIVGLEHGADDYMQKPFDERELLARIRSLMRRRSKAARLPKRANHRKANVAGWHVDMVSRELRDAQDNLVPLTAREFELLELFVMRANSILSRDKISDMLTLKSWNPKDRSIDVTVSKLRKKMEEVSGEPSFIKTVRGAGYVLAAEVQSSSS